MSSRGWSRDATTTTTLVLLRHGVTAHTVDKRFSGGLGGTNPGLSEEGVAQARRAADWLAAVEEPVAVVASPVRRAYETAGVVAEPLGLELSEEPGLAEMEFGAWEGMTFAEVAAADQPALDVWLGSLDAAPPGGESFASVQERVLAARDRLLTAYAGRTVVAVSHVTPIKVLVADAVGAPLDAVYRMELAPASVSVVAHHGDRPSLKLFNALPPGGPRLW